jgi:hypothetical protein
MKILIFLTLGGLVVSAKEPPAKPDAVATAVGRIIMVADEYRLRGKDPEPLVMLNKIEAEYDSLKGRSADDRLRFFWSVLRHVELDGMYKYDLFALARADCQDLLVEKIKGLMESKATPMERKWAEKQILLASGTGGKCASSLKSREELVRRRRE